MRDGNRRGGCRETKEAGALRDSRARRVLRLHARARLARIGWHTGCMSGSRARPAMWGEGMSSWSRPKRLRSLPGRDVHRTCSSPSARRGCSSRGCWRWRPPRTMARSLIGGCTSGCGSRAHPKRRQSRAIANISIRIGTPLPPAGWPPRRYPGRGRRVATQKHPPLLAAGSACLVTPMRRRLASPPVFPRWNS